MAARYSRSMPAPLWLQVMAEETASFGFQDVPRAEKASRVGEVFSSVASKYDLMNDAMSGGLHRFWKDAAAAKLNPQPGELILDVAGGTGDIARRLKKLGDKAAARRGFEPPEIHVIDINAEMLEAGRRRGEDGLQWHQGDAENLPVDDRAADAYIISFGIRNCTDIAATKVPLSYSATRLSYRICSSR